MSTNAPSTTISMANTAALRSLGSELNGWLSGIGLTQASDTGQINWTTVTLPAANTAIGYEIWAFPDLSIYFRIDWKTGGTNTNAPTMSVTVGTGSNGSGTITGQATSAVGCCVPSQLITSTTTNYASYICLDTNVFWIIWKATASSSNPSMSFSIEKTVDSTGASSGLGYILKTLNTTSGVATAGVVQSVRISGTPATFAASPSFCCVPGNITNSSNNAGQKQVFLHQYSIPDVILSNAQGTIVVAEAALGTTLTATLVGTTPQTMISMGNQMGNGNSASSSSAVWGVALRWQ